MKVRITLSVMGNDRSYVGTVSGECGGEGSTQVLAELDNCYGELSSSPMFDLVLKKGELHDATTGVSPDKLAEGLAAMQEYKERTGGERQGPGPNSE